MRARGKGFKKNITDFGMPEFYIEFVKTHSEFDKKKFSAITQEYWNMVIDAMIFENYEVRFPFRLGYLKIVKYKKAPKFVNGVLVNAQVDWGATRKLWEENPEAKTEKKLRFNSNEHSDGYRYTFWWDRRSSNVKNIGAYSFKIARPKARKLAAVIKSGEPIDFYEHPMKTIFKCQK